MKNTIKKKEIKPYKSVSMRGRKPKTAVLVYWGVLKRPGRKKREELSNDINVPLATIRYKLWCLKHDKQLIKKVKKTSPCCFAKIVKQKGNLICSNCKGIVWEAGESENKRIEACLIGKKEYERYVKNRRRKYGFMIRLFYDTLREYCQINHAEFSQQWMNDRIIYLNEEFKKILPILNHELLEKAVFDELTNGLELP